MIILSAESSCDDTSVAVTEDGRTVLSDEFFAWQAMEEEARLAVPEWK